MRRESILVPLVILSASSVLGSVLPHDGITSQHEIDCYTHGGCIDQIAIESHQGADGQVVAVLPPPRDHTGRGIEQGAYWWSGPNNPFKSTCAPGDRRCLEKGGIPDTPLGRPIRKEIPSPPHSPGSAGIHSPQSLKPVPGHQHKIDQKPSDTRVSGDRRSPSSKVTSGQIFTGVRPIPGIPRPTARPLFKGITDIKTLQDHNRILLEQIEVQQKQLQDQQIQYQRELEGQIKAVLDRSNVGQREQQQQVDSLMGPMGVCPVATICVHWQLCRDGFVIADGSGIIDKTIGPIPQRISASYESCGGDMICCGIPQGTGSHTLPESFIRISPGREENDRIPGTPGMPPRVLTIKGQSVQPEDPTDLGLKIFPEAGPIDILSESPTRPGSPPDVLGESPTLLRGPGSSAGPFPDVVVVEEDDVPKPLLPNLPGVQVEAEDPVVLVVEEPVLPVVTSLDSKPSGHKRFHNRPSEPTIGAGIPERPSSVPQPGISIRGHEENYQRDGSVGQPPSGIQAPAGERVPNEYADNPFIRDQISGLEGPEFSRPFAAEIPTVIIETEVSPSISDTPADTEDLSTVFRPGLSIRGDEGNYQSGGSVGQPPSGIQTPPRESVPSEYADNPFIRDQITGLEGVKFSRPLTAEIPAGVIIPDKLAAHDHPDASLSIPSQPTSIGDPSLHNIHSESIPDRPSVLDDTSNYDRVSPSIQGTPTGTEDTSQYDTASPIGGRPVIVGGLPQNIFPFQQPQLPPVGIPFSDDDDAPLTVIIDPPPRISPVDELTVNVDSRIPPDAAVFEIAPGDEVHKGTDQIIVPDLPVPEYEDDERVPIELHDVHVIQEGGQKPMPNKFDNNPSLRERITGQENIEPGRPHMNKFSSGTAGSEDSRFRPSDPTPLTGLSPIDPAPHSPSSQQTGIPLSGITLQGHDDTKFDNLHLLQPPSFEDPFTSPIIIEHQAHPPITQETFSPLHPHSNIPRQHTKVMPIEPPKPMVKQTPLKTINNQDHTLAQPELPREQDTETRPQKIMPSTHDHHFTDHELRPQKIMPSIQDNRFPVDKLRPQKLMPGIQDNRFTDDELRPQKIMPSIQDNRFADGELRPQKIMPSTDERHFQSQAPPQFQAIIPDERGPSFQEPGLSLPQKIMTHRDDFLTQQQEFSIQRHPLHERIHHSLPELTDTEPQTHQFDGPVCQEHQHSSSFLAPAQRDRQTSNLPAGSRHPTRDELIRNSQDEVDIPTPEYHEHSHSDVNFHENRFPSDSDLAARNGDNPNDYSDNPFFNPEGPFQTNLLSIDTPPREVEENFFGENPQNVLRQTEAGSNFKPPTPLKPLEQRDKRPIEQSGVRTVLPKQRFEQQSQVPGSIDTHRAKPDSVREEQHIHERPSISNRERHSHIREEFNLDQRRLSENERIPVPVPSRTPFKSDAQNLDQRHGQFDQKISAHGSDQRFEHGFRAGESSRREGSLRNGGSLKTERVSRTSQTPDRPGFVPRTSQFGAHTSDTGFPPRRGPENQRRFHNGNRRFPERNGGFNSFQLSAQVPRRGSSVQQLGRPNKAVPRPGVTGMFQGQMTLMTPLGTPLVGDGGMCSASSYCVREQECNPHNGFIIMDPNNIPEEWRSGLRVPKIRCLVPGGIQSGVCCQLPHPIVGPNGQILD